MRVRPVEVVEAVDRGTRGEPLAALDPHPEQRRTRAENQAHETDAERPVDRSGGQGLATRAV